MNIASPTHNSINYAPAAYSPVISSTPFIMDIHNSMRPKMCFRHLDNYVRDPTHSNVPSNRLLKELFNAQLVGLLHHHNGVHWGLSLMIHKGQRIHVINLDSLNNTYPDLDNDLQLFWTRAAHAAQQLHLLSGHAPRTIIHHIQLPCQTNNVDCGIFVLAYQRAAQFWINTHMFFYKNSSIKLPKRQ